MTMTTNFRLADSVLARLIQIIQEGFLTGTDVSDHMRMMRLEVDADQTNVLVMTNDYKEQVELNHKKLLDFAEEHARQQLTQNDREEG